MASASTAIKQIVSPARHAAFRDALVPIIPPGVQVSSTAGSGVQAGLGKIPGKLLSDGTWVGYKDWTSLRATSKHVKAWVSWGAGLGLQGRVVPGVDIDVSDPAMAADIEALAMLHLGAAPVRIGRAPRRLLAYAWAPGETPATRRRHVIGPDAIVELLGDGQQFVAEGVHPGTMKPYTWSGDMTLGLVTVAEVDGFFAALERAYPGALTAGGVGGSDRRPISWTGFKASDDLLIIDALRVLPNDYSYDEWVRLTAAVKAAANDPEGIYDAYETWSLSRDTGVATPQETRAKWDVLVDSSVGAEVLFGEVRARTGGEWCSDAMMDFESLTGGKPVGTVVPAVADEDPDVAGLDEVTVAETVLKLKGGFKDYIFVLDRCMFFERSTRDLTKQGIFNSRLACEDLPSGSSTKCATAVFLNSPRGKRLEKADYMVGQGHVVQGKVNLWKPPVFEPKANPDPKDVQVFLDHMEYLVADPVAREALMAWLAHFVQRPAERPSWGVLLQGTPGTGKSAIVKLLHNWLHPDSARNVSSKVLRSSFNAWASRVQLVVCQETKGLRADDYNELKTLFTEDRVSVHRKGQDPVDETNHARMLMLSNYDDALWIDQHDRRFLVVECADRQHAAGAAHYKALFDLIDGGPELVIDYLAAVDLAGWDFFRNAPVTDARDALIDETRSDLESWVRDAVAARTAPFDRPMVLTATDVEYLPGRLRGAPGAAKQMGRALRAVGALEVRFRGGDGGRSAQVRRGWVLPWAKPLYQKARETVSAGIVARALFDVTARGLMVVDDAFGGGIVPCAVTPSTVDTPDVGWLLDEARKLMEADADDNVVEFPRGRIT
jgi:hypothetical protein